jgi:hypothetical protein
MSIEALKRLIAAVEAIPEDVEGWMPDSLTDALIDARQAIAEAEKQEPVAICEYCEKERPVIHAPQREWVGLTDEDRLKIRSQVQKYTPLDSVKYGAAIQLATERALEEKNK